MQQSSWRPRPDPRRKPAALPLKVPAFAVLVALATLVLAALVLIGCSAKPAGTAPANPALPVDVQAPGTMDQPTLLVGYDGPSRAPIGPVQIPVRKDYSHSVQLRWESHLDLRLVGQQLTVTPAAAIDRVDWQQGTSIVGEDWTVASLIFKNPTPGDTVAVRLAAGVRSEDGRAMAKDVSFEVAFVEITRVEITLRGPSFLPGKTAVASSADTAFPAILRPGEAQLAIAFSQPVNRGSTWTLLLTQLNRNLPGGQTVALTKPDWTDDSRHLSVRIEQPAPGQIHADPFHHVDLELAQLLDARGLPVEPTHASLRWFVVNPLPVYRSLGTEADAQPAGSIASLPALLPAGSQPVQGGLLLTTHIVGSDGDDCGDVASLVWNLATGDAVPLGEPQLVCTAATTEWLPDGKGILSIRDRSVVKFTLEAAKAFTAGEAPQPQHLYVPPEGSFLIGAALSPDGRLALFEARPAPDNKGKIDLLLLNLDGSVLQRIKDVSDLIASEGLWRPIDAAWSPDGAALAFLPYRQGDGGGEAHLSLWREGAFSQPGPSGWSLSWRPGTSQVLLRTDNGVLLLDTANNEVVKQDLSPLQAGWNTLWSPDGRYVAVTAEGKAAVLNLETGKVRQGAFLPLGWGENDELYWAATNE